MRITPEEKIVNDIHSKLQNENAKSSQQSRVDTVTHSMRTLRRLLADSSVFMRTAVWTPKLFKTAWRFSR